MTFKNVEDNTLLGGFWRRGDGSCGDSSRYLVEVRRFPPVIGSARPFVEGTRLLSES
jgi:hypothetical protein